MTMPSSDPSTKPTTTSSEVIQVWRHSCSAPIMRTNSDHTREGGGSMNAGTPMRPGSHSHAASTTTSTAMLAATTPPVNGLSFTGPLPHELVGEEVVHRRLLRDDALRHVELLQRGEALRIHRAQHLLPPVGV